MDDQPLVDPGDLDVCEQEPLAFSGLVQDVGALLATPAGAHQVSHLSTNAARWFELPDAGEEIGLQSLFVDDCDYFVHRRRDIFEGHHYLVANVISNRGIEGDLLLSEHAGYWLHEFEEKPVVSPDSTPTREVAVTVSEYALPESIEVDASLRRIHALTDYPKIMLYRFLEDGTGEVVAELSDQRLDPYLGLRFPASDIPQIARNLYAINPFRLIFDTRTATSEVRAAQRDGALLDLSTSTLRSVSPVHIEYLHNMGVRSSASFPVRVMGKLWGLVALHAVDPTSISIAQRVAVRQIVEHKLSRKLMDARIRAEHRRFNDNAERLKRSATALIGALRDGRLAEFPRELGELIGSDALLILLGGKLVYGTPLVNAEELQSLREIGRAQALRGLFANNAIGGFIEQDADFQQRVSGMLYCCTGNALPNGGIELLWLRKEQASTVQWAGQPAKVQREVDGQTRISPRQSFAAWSEKTQGRATPWSSADQLIASKLMVRVLSGVATPLQPPTA